MNSTPPASSALSNLIRLEPAPAFGQGKLSVEQDQTMCLLAHLFPVIIYPLKKNDSPAVAAHGKEALNFGITLFICLFPLSFIAGFLGTFIALLFSLVSMVVSLAALGLVIYAMIQSRQGKLLRYPVNFRLLK